MLHHVPALEGKETDVRKHTWPVPRDCGRLLFPSHPCSLRQIAVALVRHREAFQRIVELRNEVK